MTINKPNYILFDDYSWHQLLPLTYTRPSCEIRVGILTIKEKWEHRLKSEVSFQTVDYLSKKFPIKLSEDNIFINGSVLPGTELIKAIENLNTDEALVSDKTVIAVRLSGEKAPGFKYDTPKFLSSKNFPGSFIKIDYPWHIFEHNGTAITQDFTLVTRNKESEDFIRNNHIQHPENIFVEKGASIEFATINASFGPVYIGKNTEIMEGAIIRGPFALCNNATVKMGAKIYGPTTIGPHSKVGGEVNNSVILGFSNKAHDGFMGQSVIGEWCNLGADTNTSNLKNNYAEVKVWNYNTESFVKTGLQFCGLIMGDHSKCGINTMFNSGTVVGVNSNIFGTGYPRNFIPSFSWGGPGGFTTYALNKAFEVAESVMERRKIPFTDIDKEILQSIFNTTEKYRIR
ncbi:MAG: GlmU family protein [Bacteroidales bacterium]|nr:GlmU family protein [Bacteroidales bacterium]